jgi:lipopolysaccharide transport system ATP-binding protein
LADAIDIEMTFRVLRAAWRLSVHVYLEVLGGPRLLVSMDNYLFENKPEPRPAGTYTERCRIPAHFLNEGTYSVEALICVNPMAEENLSVKDAVIFSVADDGVKSLGRSDWTREWPGSLVRPEFKWYLSYSPDV